MADDPSPAPAGPPDDGDDPQSQSHRHYIAFAVILGLVILGFAAISVTVVTHTP